MPHPEQEQVKELSAMERMIAKLKIERQTDCDNVVLKELFYIANDLLEVERNREIDMVGKGYTAGWLNGHADGACIEHLTDHPDKDTYIKSIFK